MSDRSTHSQRAREFLRSEDNVRAFYSAIKTTMEEAADLWTHVALSEAFRGKTDVGGVIETFQHALIALNDLLRGAGFTPPMDKALDELFHEVAIAGGEESWHEGTQYHSAHQAAFAFVRTINQAILDSPTQSDYRTNLQGHGPEEHFKLIDGRMVRELAALIRRVETAPPADVAPVQKKPKKTRLEKTADKEQELLGKLLPILADRKSHTLTDEAIAHLMKVSRTGMYRYPRVKTALEQRRR